MIHSQTIITTTIPLLARSKSSKENDFSAQQATNHDAAAGAGAGVPAVAEQYKYTSSVTSR